ncbi:MAG TPA: S8 family serine peptidase [Pseudonocardiaceae bacterium]
MSRTRVPGSARRIAARSAVAVLAAALTAGFTGAGSAAGQPSNLAPSAPSPAKSLAKSAVSGGKLAPRLASANGPVTAFIELAETPAVDAYNTDLRRGKAAAKAAGKAAKSKVDNRAATVLATLRGKDRAAKELGRTRNAVPGLTVVADAAKLRELSSDPNVRSIRLAVPKTIDNSGAAQLTRVLTEWQTTGKLGDNVRVGIIDTGIDYTHAGFGGPGTAAAFDAVNPDVADPNFPTAKVVGGWDFVGDAYDASSDDPAVATPVPDPNPLDCNGHGSHVAGTSAGIGVNADGSTFTGDYTQLTGDGLNQMLVGPGMAPKALLYALKVFGCDGSTDVTSQALDWALDPDQDGDFTDHLDIVNLSLGSDYGAPDDPDSLFVKKLNANGVLTVFSAGNGNDLYDIGGSPGNTPEALTVASTRDSYVLRDAMEVVAPADVAGGQAGQYSVNYNYANLDLTDDVIQLTQANNLDGCAPLNATDAARVNGKIAWLEWDDNDATRRCGSGGRTNNVTAAGAVGAVLTSTLENFPAGIAGNAAIPVFQLTGAGTNQLRPAMEAGTLRVRMATELLTSLKTNQPAIEDTPSSFTSRGTRTNVKPDVAAPGDTIASVGVGTGFKPSVNSGTSMAAPHVAGIAALIRQSHPDWSPAEVKAAVMNTASANVFSQENHGGPIHAPNRVGTGRVDAKNAVDNQVLAYVEDRPGVVTAGFGVVEVGTAPVSLSKIIRVVNKSTQRVSFDVAYTPITQMPGVRYELDRSSVTLNPRGIAKIRVTLKIDDPGALRKVADPTVEKLQLDVPRQFVADASGRVDLTPTQGSSIPLRVSVYSAPKPTADINTPAHIRVGGSGQGVLNLSGRGIAQGSGDARYASLISVLELQAQSPRLPDCGNGVTTNCAMNETAKGGDLRYVGAASTAPLANAQGNPENAMLAFGIATWGDWYNIGSNTQPFVDIDVDGDGTFDFETFLTKPTDTDVLVAATVDLNSGATVDLQPINGQFGDVDTNVFDTNVAVLPVLLTALGIDPTADTSRITYSVGVAGFYASSDGLVDYIPNTLSFDPLKPGLWVQGGGDAALAYQSRPGTALVVNRDPAALAADGADSLLVLNHHNAKGDRASVVKVNGPTANTDGRRI